MQINTHSPVLVNVCGGKERIYFLFGEVETPAGQSLGQLRSEGTTLENEQDQQLYRCGS